MFALRPPYGRLLLSQVVRTSASWISEPASPHVS